MSTTPIAYFVPTGAVFCPTCANTCYPALWVDGNLVRIYEDNIRPYSQTCHRCDILIVDGLRIGPVIAGLGNHRKYLQLFDKQEAK